MDSSESMLLSRRKTLFKTCKNCNKDFFAKSTFYWHKKSCKSLDEVKDPSHVCVCGKTFTGRTSYYRHKKVCESAQSANQSQNDRENFICFEDSCSFTSVYQADFLSHLKDIHFIECNEEVKEFQSYTEFQDWKEEYERTTKASFISKFTKRKLTEKIRHYICNRSGRFTSQSKGKRRIKAQGSSKIGFKCPASIRVQIKNDSKKIIATIYPMHYGHDNELVHLRISKSDRRAVASQLSLGIEKSRVLNNMFSIYPNNLERQHLVTKKDIRNISKAYGLEGTQKHAEDPSTTAYNVDSTDNVNNEIELPNQNEEDYDPEFQHVIFVNNEEETEENQVEYDDIDATSTDSSISEDSYIFKHLTTDSNLDLTELRSNVLTKAIDLCHTIKNCESKDLLLSARAHINSAISVLKLQTSTTVSTSNDNTKKISENTDVDKQRRFYYTKLIVR